MRLKIPRINVDAAIEHVGVLSTGEMGNPAKTEEVAWFTFGPRPGEKGSAVIAGHFDGKNGEIGVFANLSKLKAGDTLSIEDDKGRSQSFEVKESKLFDPGYADDVFSRNDGTFLNLVTCEGQWDESKQTYSKRLVVFAEIVR